MEQTLSHRNGSTLLCVFCLFVFLSVCLFVCLFVCVLMYSRDFRGLFFDVKGYLGWSWSLMGGRVFGKVFVVQFSGISP